MGGTAKFAHPGVPRPDRCVAALASRRPWSDRAAIDSALPCARRRCRASMAIRRGSESQGIGGHDPGIVLRLQGLERVTAAFTPTSSPTAATSHHARADLCVLKAPTAGTSCRRLTDHGCDGARARHAVAPRRVAAMPRRCPRMPYPPVIPQGSAQGSSSAPGSLISGATVRFTRERVEPTRGFEPRTCCLRNSVQHYVAHAQSVRGG
jgi:hypothetical protein